MDNKITRHAFGEHLFTISEDDTRSLSSESLAFWQSDKLDLHMRRERARGSYSNPRAYTNPGHCPEAFNGKHVRYSLPLCRVTVCDLCGAVD